MKRQPGTGLVTAQFEVKIYQLFSQFLSLLLSSINF